MKISLKKPNLYLILFPILCPRGFLEVFPIYKLIIVVWLAIALAIMFVEFIKQLAKKKVRLDKNTIIILSFFLFMLLETLAIKGRIGEGLQKLFVTPALCLFMLLKLNTSSKKLIDTIGNILIFDFVLNLTIFNPIIFQKMFNTAEQICFLGHVQVCPQFGLLGIAIALLLSDGGYKRKSKLIILLSILTMLSSRTDASRVVLLLLILSWILWKLKIRNLLADIQPKVIFVVCTIVQAVAIFVVVYYQIDFGARYFVYIDALQKLQSHYMTGYGVYGVLIHTFWMEWEGTAGMNYAHNEVLQILLDGGILLLIMYAFLFYQLFKHKKVIKDIFLRYWFNVVLIAFLAVGAVESVTEYNYFYIFVLLNVFISKFRDVHENTEPLKLHAKV